MVPVYNKSDKIRKKLLSLRGRFFKSLTSDCSSFMFSDLKGSLDKMKA